MKTLVISIVLAILVTGCASMPSPRQAQKVKDNLCTVSQYLDKDKDINGLTVDEWCKVGDQIIDVYGKLREAKKNAE